ncbi:potassium channel family protein [Alteribacillus bidgolensis]|uniref:Voltage-gated potassium channel n=1 Tax=Alteribacillus bidgolensis TaxID=930129 RepID=A0A1G8JKZ6_9BACI|nr:potassium channel family protein [Alteribacillus bidgolensis]SDI31969.1 voltage-gated potassium channel [Alteribacillus bidgolensis]
MLIGLIRKVLKKSINIEHWKLILMGVIFIVLSSFIVYYLEPSEFKNRFNAFWYVMTTISQVGLGDYIPKTNAGKLYSILLYLVGVGFFAIIIAKWIDLLNIYEELKEKKIMGYTGKNHIVVVHWSKKAKITIDEMLGQNSTTEVVLIDQLNESPLQKDGIHYVQGNPTKLDTLHKANVLHADSICIFASDDTIDETAADGKTLLIASTIKQYAKQKKSDVYTIVEMLDEDHISNANLDCIDDFILSNKPFSHLMAKTALQKHYS